MLYLVPRGSPGRLPTDYEINLSLAYNVRVGPVTVTPQLYIFNLLNRQTETADDDGFNTNLGTFTNFRAAGARQPGFPEGLLSHQPSSAPSGSEDRFLTIRSARGGFVRPWLSSSAVTSIPSPDPIL